MIQSLIFVVRHLVKKTKDSCFRKQPSLRMRGENLQTIAGRTSLIIWARCVTTGKGIRETTGFSGIFLHQPVLLLPSCLQVGVFSSTFQHFYNVAVIMLDATDHSTCPHSTATLFNRKLTWMACMGTHLQIESSQRGDDAYGI